MLRFLRIYRSIARESTVGRLDQVGLVLALIRRDRRALGL
jgi:hypothetical protein